MTEVAHVQHEPDPGLQPERTALAWTRTSLGFLANGALLFLRDAGHYSGPLRLMPAALALGLAIVVYGIGRVRLHALRGSSLPIPLVARRQILLIGWSMVALIIVTAVLLGV